MFGLGQIPSYPYLSPNQIHLTESEALDVHLEHFYNLCTFQKPTSSVDNPTNEVFFTSNPPTNEQASTSKLLTNNENGKPVMNYTQVEIGKMFFGEFVQMFAPWNLVDWFVRLYLRLPFYLQHREAEGFGRNFTRQGLNFQSFLFHCFLLFIKKSKEDERKLAKNNPTDKKQIRICDEPSGSMYNFNEMEQNTLLCLLIRTDFPPSSKVWFLASSANLTAMNKGTMFPIFVQEATGSGEIGFWALKHAICRFGTSLNVEILANLLLFGEHVDARMIEEFVSDRTEEEREKARQIILRAEREWGNDITAYQTAAFEYNRRLNVPVILYEHFRENMTDLMIELRREIPRFNLVSFPWARAAVKIYAEKHYVKKETSIEQLYDIVYTVLKQRTNLRPYIVQAFRTHKDFISAEYWNNFFIDPGVNQFSCAINHPKKNVPPKIIYCLNDVVDMNEVREGFMSIPTGIDVFVVDKAPKLSVVEHHIRQCENSSQPVIGLDSEWSPYVCSTRASILQIAFQSAIFILDLDSIKDKELTCFVDKLFRNPKIIKIGFQFAEDLLQLRKKLPNCLSLYEPVNLIDLSKLIAQLITLSDKAKVSYDEYIKFPPKETEETELKTDIEQTSEETRLDESFAENIEDPNVTTESVEGNAENGADAATLKTKAGPSMRKNSDEQKKGVEKVKQLGLSSICQMMFDKRLDKSEQCSVWTRRPLRKLQIRYAALDSFVILIIYDRCVEWAKKLNVDIKNITATQERMRAPVPLFFNRTELLSKS